MNILFICNNLPPLVDGVGDYTYNIAQQFACNGHNVHIICRRSAKIDTTCANMKIVPMVEKWNRQAGRDISDYVRTQGVEVVSLQFVPHGFHAKGVAWGLACALREIRQTGVKIMTFCHEVYVFDRRPGLKGWAESALTRWATSRVLALSDTVATSIECYRDLIANISHHKDVPVMPIVSNIPRSVLPEAQLKEMRKKVAADDEKIVAFFGLRQIDLSIKAICRLRSEGMRIKVLFIGKVPNGFKYAELEDSFRTGVLEVEAIADYLMLPDVLLVPEQSHTGCSFKSGSLAAALQSGLAVVTGKGTMTSSTLIDGQNIIFADFNSTDSICNALRKLLSDANLRHAVGMHARQLLASRTWEHTYNEYLRLVQ